MRFPLPPGHKARSLTYTVDNGTLRGSHPDRCHADDRDPDTGECVVKSLADGLSWDDEVQAGIFIMWGSPDRCDRWLMTGPHPPSDYTWGATHTVAGARRTPRRRRTGGHTAGLPAAFRLPDGW